MSTDATGREVGPAPAGLLHQNQEWWAFRGPRDDAEREQLLGLQFTPSLVMEGRLAVQERAPELHGMLPLDERARVADYAKRREARLRLGPPVEIPAIDVDRIDRAARILRSVTDDDRSRAISQANDRGRDAFRAAITERRWAEVLEAWTDWLEELAVVRARVNRLQRARADLGLPGSEFVVSPPVFLDELGQAMDVLGRMIFSEADAGPRS